MSTPWRNAEKSRLPCRTCNTSGGITEKQNWCKTAVVPAGISPRRLDVRESRTFAGVNHFCLTTKHILGRSRLRGWNTIVLAKESWGPGSACYERTAEDFSVKSDSGSRIWSRDECRSQAQRGVFDPIR